MRLDGFQQMFRLTDEGTAPDVVLTLAKDPVQEGT